jgi:phospholipid/cholesterol/gamma-HCH transport system substrate-binding protein
VALQPALDDLERFVVESDPAADAFPPFLRKLEKLTANSVPTFKSLRLLFNGPGAGNDLYDTFRDLPPLDKLAKSSFPRARKSLADSTPVWGFIRPYVPDFVAWLRSFGGVMGTYDANGHYARTMPIFDVFNYVEDADGGSYTPKPPAERGRSPFLKLGNLKRCPGASTPAPSDGSAPFVDSGELANPDCDPSQRVGTP